MKQLCFATNNANKLIEVQALVADQYTVKGLRDIGCYDDIPEEEGTIEGNSQYKAQYVFNKFHQACFADDTGLEVLALDGRPGVHSARFAGAGASSEENIKLLLDSMQGITNREARFRTVVTFLSEEGAERFEGIVRGQITEVPSGSGGFGYDSIFLPDGYDKTFAEMPLSEKNTISHRAIAINKLVEFLLNK